ncbi:MAG: hypothetical protein FWC75_01345 [Oscillospiraceae bacterium]|nr:hypothetical protein [Oscillospiraceae bacterium]
MYMNKKTKKITLSALFVALTVVSLYFASILPTGQAGLVAAASLFVAAAVIESGIGSGLSVFVVSALIGMLILPNRAAPLLFIAFFGYYPIVKSLVERMSGTAFQWILKLAVFNAALTGIWLLMRELVTGIVGDMIPVLLIYVGGNVIFVLFDYGFSKLIWFYINRISRAPFSK